MLGGNFRHSPPKEISTFRVNLLEVLNASDYLSDDELKDQLRKLTEEKVEKYQYRFPTIVLKRIH